MRLLQEMQEKQRKEADCEKRKESVTEADGK